MKTLLWLVIVLVLAMMATGYSYAMPASNFSYSGPVRGINGEEGQLSMQAANGSLTGCLTLGCEAFFFFFSCQWSVQEDFNATWDGRQFVGTAYWDISYCEGSENGDGYGTRDFVLQTSLQSVGQGLYNVKTCTSASFNDCWGIWVTSCEYDWEDGSYQWGISKLIRTDWQVDDWLPLKGTFLGVPLDYWAINQIIVCVNTGIVQGYPGGSYQPNDPVSRDQMAVYISRALSGDDASVPVGPGTPSFTDVSADYWAYKYIEYAKSQNIVQGYPDGNYAPTDKLDRGQMAVFIARAIAAPSERPDLPSYTPPDTATFPDVPTDFLSYKYVEYIVQTDPPVTLGYPDGSYHPGETVTRDQMAVYIQRAFQLPMS